MIIHDEKKKDFWKRGELRLFPSQGGLLTIQIKNVTGSGDERDFSVGHAFLLALARIS